MRTWEDEANECAIEAAAARLRAIFARSRRDRRVNTEMAARWRRLERAYRTAIKVSGYVEWRTQRLDLDDVA